MAKFSYTDGADFDRNLDKIGREGVKAIVMAGAEQCAADLRKVTGDYHHVRTGNMLAHVMPGVYHEDLNSGWCEVYPHGEDSRGVSNAKKAFVINYGYGARRTAKTGDKFITNNQEQFKSDVSRAMQQKSDRLVADIFK